MARPRKSPQERTLDGNPGRRPIPIEVFVPEGAPFVPEHLSDDAAACAEQIIRAYDLANGFFSDQLAKSAKVRVGRGRGMDGRLHAVTLVPFWFSNHGNTCSPANCLQSAGCEILKFRLGALWNGSGKYPCSETMPIPGDPHSSARRQP